MMADWLQIQERTLAGMALVGNDDLNANQLGLIGQHVDKLAVGDGHKILVVATAHIGVLLPGIILTDKERANAILNELVDDQAAAPMEFSLYPPITIVGQSLYMARGGLALGQTALQLSAVLVVALVDKLEWTSAHKKRPEARLV